MPSGSAITLLHFRGIRIGIDYSWFIVVFLIVLWLSGFYRDVIGAGDDAIAPYVLAGASALLFFGSILLHELGHAVVAIRNGIPISGITLWMFGGVAQLSRDTDSPGVEFKVAIAGPIVTALIVVAGAAVGITAAGSEAFGEAMLTEGDADTSGLLAMIAWLTTINALVLVFNMLPAFPLDGGRIARALAWWVTGNRRSATRFAAGLGQIFAYVMIGIGVFLFIQGAVLSGVWLALIGFILNGSARSAISQSDLFSTIEGVSVADVMDREPVAVPADILVEQALEEYYLRYRWPWFPVVDAGGRLLGILDSRTVEGTPEAERLTRRVEDLFAKGGEDLSVSEDAPLEAVLGSEALRRLGAVMAVDPDGRLTGVVTADAVGRAMEAGRGA